MRWASSTDPQGIISFWGLIRGLLPKSTPKGHQTWPTQTAVYCMLCLRLLPSGDFRAFHPHPKPVYIYIYVYILVVNLRSLDRNRSRPRGDVRRFACRVLALEEQLDSLMKQKTGIEEEIKALTSSGDGEDSWARGAEKLQQKVDEEILGSLSPA